MTRWLWLSVGLVAAAPPPGKPDAGSHGMRPQSLAHPVEIKADKLVIFDKDHEARYTGHVRVRSGTTTITCDRLLAQYTQAQEFTHIFCDDNVEAVDGDKRVKGDHGDFDNETGVVVITATPWVEIWNGKTHLWGKKATFTTGESKLEVDQPTTVIDEAGLGRDAGTPRRARDGGR